MNSIHIIAFIGLFSFITFIFIGIAGYNAIQECNMWGEGCCFSERIACQEKILMPYTILGLIFLSISVCCGIWCKHTFFDNVVNK